MSSNCLNCRKIAERKNSNVAKTKKGRIMLLSQCATCDSKKTRFIKEKGIIEQLSNKETFKNKFLSG